MPTLDFKGKPLIYAHHLSVSSRTFDVDVKKSLVEKGKPSLDDNLIIHGDNLAALKALLPRYAGRINCIYIDPPYNTGNEKWAYNDNVNSPMMKDWLQDKSPVDGEDLERHDKWLCMMWPRLQLLRELLSDGGVIFISIDDNEQHHLRMVMDEIFGEEHFVACLPTVMNLKGNNDEFGFAGTHDYALSWAKNKVLAQIGEFTLEHKDLDDWQEDDRGYYKKGANLKSTGVNAPREKRPNLYYPIFVNRNNEVFVDEPSSSLADYETILPITNGEQMSWRWGKPKVASEPYNIIVERTTAGVSLFKKQRPSIGDLPTKKPKSLFYKPEYSSGTGTAELKQIFGQKIFDTPKPVQLLKDIIAISTGHNSIILDSFAGSGTTAHAVLALNKADGGKRKFILVECEDYADKITAERVRRVIKGVPKAKDENLKNGLGGSFTYCTLGDEISIEKMLSGKNLPDYDTFARHLVYTANGQSPNKIRKARGKDGFFYEAADRLFYLIYEPNRTFLLSAESALNSTRAERIAKQVKTKNKTAVVFATHKFIGQKELTAMGITFCGLPYGRLD